MDMEKYKKFVLTQVKELDESDLEFVVQICTLFKIYMRRKRRN